MENGNLPAYPLPREISETMPNTGLSKREMFAMAAMQGLCSAYHWQLRKGMTYEQDVASLSIAIADELLKQLSTPLK